MSEDARRNSGSTTMAEKEKVIRDLIVQNPVPLEKLRALVSHHRNRFPSALWQIPILPRTPPAIPMHAFCPVTLLNAHGSYTYSIPSHPVPFRLPLSHNARTPILLI